MCDNCKCNGNQIEIDNSSLDTLRSQPKIKIIEVEADYGTQLKFAVPESGMNEPSVDVVEELWNDISGYFFNKIVYNPVDEDAILLGCTKKDIEKIFEKYRK